MTEQEKNEQEKILRKNRLKLFFLSIYSIILIFLFFFLTDSGINSIISFLIVLFLFFIVIGPVLSGMRRSLYSRMFTRKKEKLDSGYQQHKETVKKQGKIDGYKPKNIRPVNLNIKYKKPLIGKCSNCGMIVAGFVKKCPQCGELL